jgi:2'-5' RNA ligase
LTLKFFGDIYERDLVDIGGAVEGRAAAEAPVHLRAGGVGAFPNPDRARVLWIGLDGDLARLSRLQRDLDEAFEGLGYPREKRSFKPHLTLGRARGERILGVQEVLRKGETQQAGSFEAGGLILFRSELKPGGAVYTKMAEFPFLGSGEGTPAGAAKG